MKTSSSLVGRICRRFFFEPLSLLQESRLPDCDVILNVGSFQMKVFAPRRNRIGRALYQTGVWEPEVTGAIRALVRADMVVYDIGGDAGYHSLLFARAVGVGGRVIVFEPIPQAQERIEENLRLNGFTNVSLQKLALGRSRGSFVLEKPFEASRINLDKASADVGDIKVELHRLDDLMASEQLPAPDFIKIDVEGAELEVLVGMEAMVARCRPTFLIELHPDFLPQFGATVDDVLHWLEKRNYLLTAVDAGEISRTSATTFLAVPGPMEVPCR
jgi:FkbM family methyltransferase